MFQRKNKETFESYVKDNNEIKYLIKYKKIKHIYFRFKDNILEISANEKLSKNDVIHALDVNFDKIIKLRSKKQTRIKVEKYQLWGKTIEEDAFFNGLKPNEKLMHEIYIKETIQMIDTLSNRLSEDLNVLGLKPVKIIVKPLKTKYGSCHIVKRVITINSFLAKLDPIYLYYVLLHEYAHLLVANHQSAFYQKLDLVMKNHKLVQKNLRKHTIMF